MATNKIKFQRKNNMMSSLPKIRQPTLKEALSARKTIHPAKEKTVMSKNKKIWKMNSKRKKCLQ